MEPNTTGSSWSMCISTAFEAVHRRSFTGDPAANPRLRVEVLCPAVVAGFPTAVLVTPWALNGIILPASADDASGAAVALWQNGFPAELEVAGQGRTVFLGELPEIGPYRSVGLVPDVSRLTRPEQARTLGTSFAAPFQQALESALKLLLG